MKTEELTFRFQEPQSGEILETSVYPGWAHTEDYRQVPVKVFRGENYLGTVTARDNFNCLVDVVEAVKDPLEIYQGESAAWLSNAVRKAEWKNSEFNPQ